MHEILSLLGLCLRAGKLVSGDDAVADTVNAGEARLLILAADAGANITRRAKRHQEEKKIPILKLTDNAQALGWALGRKTTAICCITDIGFAAAAVKKAAAVDEAYSALAQQLNDKKKRIDSRRGVRKTGKKAVRKTDGMKQSTYTKRGGDRA